jgi:hypothetical protein
MELLKETAMKVRIIHGATHAYAAIEHNGTSMDVQLQPGRSTAASLSESAKELHAQAQRLIRRAEIMHLAALHLEYSQAPTPPAEVE